jgi:hypothetical protein
MNDNGCEKKGRIPTFDGNPLETFCSLRENDQDQNRDEAKRLKPQSGRMKILIPSFAIASTSEGLINVIQISCSR